MLKKPDLNEVEIIEAVAENYGIKIRQLEFLPAGADMNTFLFRGTSKEGSQYFIKLRSGVFEELAVVLPKFLLEQGITQVISPQETISGMLWIYLGWLQPCFVSLHSRKKRV